MKLKVVFVCIIGLWASPLLAEDQEPIAAAVSTETVNIATERPVKWKADLTTYYYNFEGTQASTKAPYTFGETTLNMQLLTLQYQASPTWTIMAIGQYLENYSVTKAFNQQFEDRTKGVGDTVILALRPVYANGPFLVFADAGLSLPTGSIDERNKYDPQSDYVPNLQLGSGTVDPMVAVTPMYIGDKIQLGSRLASTIRTNQKNDNGYHLGNLYRADAWADFPVGNGLTPRLVGYYKHKDSISGENPSNRRNLFNEFYYHAQINWDVSAALKYTYAIGKTVNVAAEIGAPVAQGMANNDNAVVSTEYYGNLGVNGAF